MIAVTRQNAITKGDSECILTRNCKGTEQLQYFSKTRPRLDMNGIWSLHILTVRDPVGVDHLDEIHVIGGKCLNGNITVQGSKNTVLPIMAGALLHSGISVLRACPRISDVCYMEEILHMLGVRNLVGRSMICIWTVATMRTEVMYRKHTAAECVVQSFFWVRSSPETSEAEIGYPGGCVIGKRPIDLHLYVLRCSGADNFRKKKQKN